MVSLVFILWLGGIILKKSSQAIIGRLFFLISVLFSVWMLGTFMMFISQNDDQIVFWDRFVYLAVVFMPAIQYHFSLAFTYYNKKRRALLGIAYVLSLFFFVISRTDGFISGVFHYRWGAHSIAHFWHHLFLAFFFFYIFALLGNFLVQYRHSKGTEKRRLIYLMLSFAILNLVGGIGYLPAYRVPIYSPVSLLAPLAFSFLMGYTIIVHRLMDIKLVMRRYLVFLISIFSIILFAAALRMIVRDYAPDYINLSDYLIIFLAVLIYSPLRDCAYRLANKYFFSSLYDSRKVISEVTDRLRATLDTDEICGNIYSVLVEAFHMRAFGVLDANEKNGGYEVKYNQGFLIGRRRVFPRNEYLRELFVEKNETMVVEEAKNTLYDSRTKKTIDLLDKFGVEIVTPLVTNDKVVGLMMFGKKESGELYNEEDLAVLKNASAQMAIAFENAMLYEEVKRFNEKLKAEVEKATLDLRKANDELKKLDQAKSEFLNIASHQLRTPVSVIKGVSSMLIAGDLERVPFEEKLKFYQSLMFKSKKLEMIIHDILNATSLTADKYNVMDKKAEAIDLNRLISEVIGDFELEIKERELEMSLEQNGKNIPKIRGQREYLKEVFINLLSNAIKYTPSSGTAPEARDRRKEKGWIRVRISNDPHNRNNVLVTVSDNGIGVAQEDIPKLFQKFSRAENAKNMYTDGTGVGLFVVREIVRGHGGEAWLESELGKGSTFFVSLPIFTKKEVNIKKYILDNPRD